MKNSPARQLAFMIALASRVHEDQTDRGGAPYILHPMRVMRAADQSDYEQMAIFVGHDVLEDCPSGEKHTIRELIAANTSTRVLSALDLLDFTDYKKDYTSGITRIIQSHNIDAIIGKMADLRDNSDITRLKGLRQQDFDRMQKYHHAYTRLSQSLAAGK